jgi:hypothetical protein
MPALRSYIHLPATRIVPTLREATILFSISLYFSLNNFATFFKSSSILKSKSKSSILPRISDNINKDSKEMFPLFSNRFKLPRETPDLLANSACE